MIPRHNHFQAWFSPDSPKTQVARSQLGCFDDINACYFHSDSHHRTKSFSGGQSCISRSPG